MRGWSRAGIIWSWSPQLPVPIYWCRIQRGWVRGPWKSQQGIFSVWQLVLVKERSRGSRLNWCLFDWYGENQHQLFWKGYDRGFNKGSDWRILHSAEEKDYGTRGKKNTCYWLQLQLTEGHIIFCYSRGGEHYVRYSLLIEVSWPKFSNVSICPVSNPFLMSRFFGSVSEVDPHNKSHQSDLALEKFWVT